MRNKEFRRNREFRPFRTRILIQTILMMITGAAVPVFLYSVLWQGKIANWTVAFFQKIFKIEYEKALLMYRSTIRAHQDTIMWSVIILTIVLIFKMGVILSFVVILFLWERGQAINLIHSITRIPR